MAFFQSRRPKREGPSQPRPAATSRGFRRARRAVSPASGRVVRPRCAARRRRGRPQPAAAALAPGYSRWSQARSAVRPQLARAIHVAHADQPRCNRRCAAVWPSGRVGAFLEGYNLGAGLAAGSRCRGVNCGYWLDRSRARGGGGPPRLCIALAVSIITHSGPRSRGGPIARSLTGRHGGGSRRERESAVRPRAVPFRRTAPWP